MSIDSNPARASFFAAPPLPLSLPVAFSLSFWSRLHPSCTGRAVLGLLWYDMMLCRSSSRCTYMYMSIRIYPTTHMHCVRLILYIWARNPGLLAGGEWWMGRSAVIYTMSRTRSPGPGMQGSQGSQDTECVQGVIRAPPLISSHDICSGLFVGVQFEPRGRTRGGGCSEESV